MLETFYFDKELVIVVTTLTFLTKINN